MPTSSEFKSAIKSGSTPHKTATNSAQKQPDWTKRMNTAKSSRLLSSKGSLLTTREKRPCQLRSKDCNKSQSRQPSKSSKSRPRKKSVQSQQRKSDRSRGRKSVNRTQGSIELGANQGVIAGQRLHEMAKYYN